MKQFFFWMIIIVWGGLLYSNTLEHSFHYDDHAFIVENTAIRDITQVEAIWNSVLPQPTRFIGLYSFALNYHFHRLDVRGYHITNILIHLINGLLVGGLVSQLLKRYLLID